MKKYFFVLFFITSFCFSQKIDKQNAKFTIRSYAGLPAGISSNLFKFSFKGTYEFGITVNYKLFNNFICGIGYQNTAFKNNPDYFTYYKNLSNTFTIPYDTRFIVNSFIINVGYDKFYTNEFYINYSIQSGIAISKFNKIIQDTSDSNKPFQPTNFSYPFIKSQISFNYIVDPKLSFNFYLGFQSLLFNYDQRSPRMNQFTDLRVKSNKQGIAWLGFGFGFNVLLNSNSKSSATQ